MRGKRSLKICHHQVNTFYTSVKVFFCSNYNLHRSVFSSKSRFYKSVFRIFETNISQPRKVER